jgi:hypothetical protein
VKFDGSFVYSIFLIFVCTCKSIPKKKTPKHYNLAQVNARFKNNSVTFHPKKPHVQYYNNQKVLRFFYDSHMLALLKLKEMFLVAIIIKLKEKFKLVSIICDYFFVIGNKAL